MDLSVLLPTARIFQTAAVAIGIIHARRRRSYRAVAIFLGAMFAATWIRWALASVLATAPKPRAGWYRLAFHVEQALFLA